jgi:hypothetical protein
VIREVTWVGSVGVSKWAVAVVANAGGNSGMVAFDASGERLLDTIYGFHGNEVLLIAGENGIVSMFEVYTFHVVVKLRLAAS